MGLGELGNFSAFAFVSVSIVAPLGAWSVVLNAFFAAWFLHESLDVRKAVGMLCCIVGGILLVSYGPSGKTMERHFDYGKLESLLWRPAFLSYLSFIILSLLVMIFVCWYTPIGNKYVIGYVTICALLGALIVISSKCLSVLLRLSIQGEHTQLLNKLFLCSLISLICFIPIQILFINGALQRFSSSQVVPVYYVLFTLSSIISSAILFDEFHNDVLLKTIPFAIGIGQTFVGVFLLNAASSSSTLYYASPRSIHTQELRNLQLLDSYLQFRSYLSYSSPFGELLNGRWNRKDSDFDLQMTSNTNSMWKGNRIIPLQTVVSRAELNKYPGRDMQEEYQPVITNENRCTEIIRTGTNLESKRNGTFMDLLFRKRPSGVTFPDSTINDVRVQAEQIRNRHRAASWADKEWYIMENEQTNNE
ncbi:Mg2+ uptake permease (NIPA), DMT family [Galdieria sulphuraria]|uniref:Mg2+ uptake permease (NIPA), DMT family n=1 Tax=Galdieria sulphuraria TaxID=130081 RepID=M2XH80_GALSU|nr:Mg2+ uptake permease (NIPA), DMT family [Galdieria sulphuraria]EME29427.1 Mg2+ uptake permease (NIPA), DMT family [Galdieria sulphuraria]|eukprot:XP_005705947.1 Mg2+ uptake permease (NIPA), DMT family [Galdieria sulphuraria]